MKRRILSMLSVFVMLCVLTMSVSAVEVPDLERLGSISVHMSYNGNIVPGGTLTLYQVGEVHLENDADYSHRIVEAFADSGVSLENLSSAQTARDLADYANANGVEGFEKEIDRRGNLVFWDLPVGVYLVIQEDAAEGYEPINPFLVTVPCKEDGKFVYHVDGTPKLELEKEPWEPTEPTEPSEPTEPTEPEPELPQTGLNNWPVPVMAMLGLCMIALGCVFVVSGKKNHHED